MKAEHMDVRSSETTEPLASIPHALRRRWRWAAMVLALCLIGGAVISRWMQPLYLAEARIRLLNDRALSDSPGSTDPSLNVRSQLYVMRSARILSPVAQALDLPGQWGISPADAVTRLQREVSPRRLVDGGIIEVQVNDPDGPLAAAIANSVVNSYSSNANQPRFSQARALLDRLKEQCDAQEQRLREAVVEAQKSRQALGIEAAESQAPSESLKPLRQQYVQAEAESIEAQLQLDGLMQSRSDPVLVLQTTPPNSTAQLLAAKLIEADSRVKELQDRLGAGHPQVRQRQLEANVAAANATRQVERIIEAAELRKSAAVARAAESRQRLSAAEQAMTASAGGYADMLFATEQEAMQRNLQHLLSDRVQKLSLDLAEIGPAAEVIEPASAPSAPAIGTPMQIFEIALLIGALAGAMLAIGIDRMDRSIREPGEVIWKLGLPLLGITDAVETLVAAAIPNDDAESFRMVRNSIDFADHTLRSLCVTAARSGEGTSMTASNLAWTWAEHGARVLLIDANLANPSIHSIFGLRNESGLSDYLSSNRAIEELVMSTFMPNVSILPAGRISTERGAAPVSISPQKLTELLIWARSNADIILFDAAPVLETSDTAILSRQADATVLVVRRGGAAASDVRRAAQMLASSGDGLLGIVLTAVSADTSWESLPLPQMMDADEAEAAEATSKRSEVSRLRKRRKDAA